MGHQRVQRSTGNCVKHKGMFQNHNSIQVILPNYKLDTLIWSFKYLQCSIEAETFGCYSIDQTQTFKHCKLLSRNINLTLLMRIDLKKFLLFATSNIRRYSKIITVYNVILPKYTLEPLIRFVVLHNPRGRTQLAF